MSKKDRHIVVPDTFEEAEAADTSTLESDGIMEAASHFVMSETEPLEITEEYMCTACFDVFTKADLNGNLDDCPNCKEKEVIMER